MPTTPISVSTGIQGLTNSTIYTVPALKTAIVKSVSGVNVQNATIALTVSKVSGGQNYVVANAQVSTFLGPTGQSDRFNVNALNEPLTMAAGEVLKVYTNSGNRYSLPNVSTGTNVADDGSNYGVMANTFANGIYMAVGYYGGGVYVATSPDAITWTQRTQPSAFATQFTILSCNGSVWVATDLNNSLGTVYYSSDNGVTWGVGVFVAGSVNVISLINNGSTFLLSATNGLIYSSTNGSTWTEVTSYNTATASSGFTIYNLGWTGSHWVVGQRRGGLASTDLINWFGYTGVNSGRLFTDVFATAYSTYYNKYYTSRNLASVPNIFSSSNGLLWTTLSTAAITPFKINCAGSNTVLIGVPSSGGATVYRSTDGTTFTTNTLSGGYVGPVIGMDNGYYLTMLNGGTNDACNLSTDPTVSTGTTRGSTVASFILNSAAADPTSGKWIGIGKIAADIVAIGGTSGTNIGSSYNLGLSLATYGIPSSICWSSADAYFYVVTDNGSILRSQQYGSGWTYQGNSGTTGSASSIKAIGTTLYIVSAVVTNSIFTSSTLTGGATFTQLAYSSFSSNGYRGVSQVSAGGSYYGIALATNGTDLVWTNTNGNSFAVTPSTSLTGMRMPYPKALGVIQTVNSNQFMYAGYDTDFYGGQYGYFTSTNLITTYGTYVKGTANIGTFSDPPNRFNYLNAIYYITNTSVNSIIYSGTTVTNILTGGYSIGASYAGIVTVNPSNGWMIDGTNLVSTQNNGYLTGVCKTTTPSSYLYAATVTASIVEIS